MIEVIVVYTPFTHFEQHMASINMGFESSAIYAALDASKGNLKATTDALRKSLYFCTLPTQISRQSSI